MLKGPETGANPEEEAEQEKIRRLAMASSRLKDDMPYYDLMGEAEKLVKEGILAHIRPGGGGLSGEDEYYYVPEKGSYGLVNVVLEIRRLPDFHTGKGWKLIGHELSRYDENGKLKTYVSKAIEGTINKKEDYEYYENGKIKTKRVLGPVPLENKLEEEITNYDEQGREIATEL